MKKLASIAFAVVLAFSLSINSFAASTSLSAAQDSNGIYVSGNSVYDFTEASYKIFYPSRTDGTYSLSSTPTEKYYSCNTEWGFSATNPRSWSKATSDYGNSGWVIDRIMAKARLYVGGALYSDGIDDQTNASYAGAKPSKFPAFHLSSDELYGSHAFEMAGYQSWYPETQA
ncbi:MAG: hypothetical protein AAGU75_18445 [Bacillota bacterium]